MIGDIDFIIQHKDEGNIIRVLEKHNYYDKNTIRIFRVFRHRHLPRTTHKSKIIAIEPHLKLLDTRYRCTFNSKKLLSTFNEGVKTNKTPSTSFLFDHCIYNFQINDYGFINAKLSHRSIYDIYKLDYKNSLTINNIKKDIFKKYFFLTIAKLNVFDLQIPSSFWSLCHYKCLRLLIFLYIKLLIIIKVLCNNHLRKHWLKKITYHYANKTLLNYIYRWVKI